MYRDTSSALQLFLGLCMVIGQKKRGLIRRDNTRTGRTMSNTRKPLHHTSFTTTRSAPLPLIKP